MAFQDLPISERVALRYSVTKWNGKWRGNLFEMKVFVKKANFSSVLCKWIQWNFERYRFSSLFTRLFIYRFVRKPIVRVYFISLLSKSREVYAVRDYAECSLLKFRKFNKQNILGIKVFDIAVLSKRFCIIHKVRILKINES